MKDVRISIRLTEEEHKNFKMIAIKQNKKMQDLLSAFVRKEILKNEKKQIGQALLPIIFFLLHIAYGVGTLVGLIQMPFKRKGMFHSKEGDRR